MDTLSKVKTALLCMQRHSWEQGVAMQAFWESGDYQTACTLGGEAAYRNMPDGRLAAIGGMEAATDPCAVGEVLIWMIGQKTSKELNAACKGLLDWALSGAPRNNEGIVYHMVDSKQFWVDSIYMLPPFLAAAGRFQEALAQIDGYWKALYLPEKKLLAHRWDDDAGEFIRADAWGTGNGWAMAGLCRVIDLLKPGEFEAERERLIRMNRELISSVAGYIREDGLAHDVLDDPKSFEEAALPMLFAYSVYRGMHSGWLGDDYKTLAERCRKAATAKVDELGFIHDVAGAPHFDKPGISPEAQAFFIMMESARKKI